MNTIPPTDDMWHERGYLPHLEQQKVQVITFRLYDSVPKAVIEGWKKTLEDNTDAKNKENQIKQVKQKIDQFEDSGHGQCFMRNKDVAKAVEDTLLYDNEKLYHLISWCIMPNHVHVMIEVLNDSPISTIVQHWKSVSAHKANHILNREGPFWMQEYFDRFVRNMDHYNSAIRYIDMNPIKAGLTQYIGDWRWSSAYYHLHVKPLG